MSESKVKIITEMCPGELSTSSLRWKSGWSCRGCLGSLVCALNHLEALAGSFSAAADANDLRSLTVLKLLPSTRAVAHFR